MDEVGRLLSAIAETRERGGRAALATVVRVRGSAYRREGTKMLIGEDGSQVCMISGGCLEQEVGEIAGQVLASGVPTVQHFDLDEDVMWGLGIGCGGSLDVYIEPFDDGAAYGSWHEAVETQRAACLATVIESSAEAFVPVGARLFVGEDGATSGGVHAELDPILEEQAGVVMAQLYPAARTEAYRTPDGVTLEVFLDVTVPPPGLVLFGAGHDAIPLARLADQLGFKVSVVDPRHAFVTAERFPHAGLVRSHPAGYREAVVLSPRSFVIVMNHHLERDRHAFAFAIASEAPYIGVLGPRSRFEQIASELSEEGFSLSDGDRRRIRNPVGVDVGAETPEEIAVSVLAEVLAVRGGYRAGFLSGRPGPIHRLHDRS